jgi:hypothetical protein
MVKMWNLKTWEAYATFSGHEQCASSVTTAVYRGPRVYSAGFDCLVAEWSIQPTIQRIHADAAVAVARTSQKKKTGDGSTSPRKKK